jgi:two-component system chemotaxis sensor kinase CheA
MKISDYIELYRSEADDIFHALENGIIGLESGEDPNTHIEELFRHAHNLKGISGAMGYDNVVTASHALENYLDAIRKGEVTAKRGTVDTLLEAVDLMRRCVAFAFEEEDSGKGAELAERIAMLLAGLLHHDNLERDRAQPAEELPVDSSAEDGAAGDTGSAAFREPIRTTRVELERLDRIMTLVGELIISRIRFSSLAKGLESKAIFDELEASGRLVSEIQREVMEARLVPVGQVCQRFKRLIRDTSKTKGKSVRFDIVGAEIGVDRSVLEGIVDPLVHLIRNAIDHGIETPDERNGAGKPEEAVIQLSARRERNHIVLEVSDDGRGIDLQRVVDKGVATGLSVGGQKDMTEEELCRILSAPGFSTSSGVDTVSGRGMGMNIVKRTVDSLGGTMHIRSTAGKGTSISLHLPVNLSIIKALMFCVGEEVHAVPIEYIQETTRVEYGSLRSLQGKQVFVSSDGPIPIIRPWEIFDTPAEEEDGRYMKLIVVDTGKGKAGIVVKQILGQQEIVIKGLPAIIRGISGISGATILGSGKVAFIWDPHVIFGERCTYEPDKETFVSAS